MILRQSDDQSTEAQIYVEDWHGSAVNLKREFVNTVAFSYSNDVLQLGDPFSVTVPNPRGEYNERFQVGARIKLYLKNPNVAGGELTLKHTGVIVSRDCTSSRSGTIIQVNCADLGWHLQNNDAPLWFNLRQGTFEGLLNNRKWIDPAWGFTGVQLESESAKRKRLHNGRADVNFELNQQAIQPLYYLQVEPGDKIADILFQYARRLNLLVNVGPDGKIIVWNPDYSQKPLYALHYHRNDEPTRSLNNVESVRVHHSMETIYTDVVCVGERVQFEFDDPNNPNAAKLRGQFQAGPPYAEVLPFPHWMIFADGEMFQRNLARKHAEWKYKRGIYDSWEARYTVKGHWGTDPNGQTWWWEADTMCELHDTVHGHEGLFYVASVRCDRTPDRGDTTEVVLKKPGLLSAAFGELPRAPTIKYSKKDEGGKTTTTPTTTTVQK